MSLFTHRDAFADYAAIPSTLQAEREPAGGVRPLVTIAIPTYRRPDELMEAIASALAQATDVPFEILVVDNDPDPQASAAIAARLPQSPRVGLRYYCNAENIGMFGNWNRCIELARGDWVTLLNDDDLLRPEYLPQTMDMISRRPEIDGIVCSKGYHYRSDEYRHPEATGVKARLWRRAKKLRFDRHGLAPVTPRNMFFGLELGNGLGFLFRRDAAIKLGGYYPEDFPMSDGYFYVRYCVRHRLFWTHRILADIGIGENESMRPETLDGAIYKLKILRESLLGRYVPASWRRLLPQLVANSIRDAQRLWKVELDKEKFERDFGMTIPEPNYRKVTAFRLAHRAY